MAKDEMRRWWVVIKNESWLSKSHGAFTLSFLTNNDLLGAKKESHIHHEKANPG